MRSFLRPLVLLLSLGSFFCASVQADTSAGTCANTATLDDRIAAGARILTVNAHPDDETLVSPLLVRACIERGNACRFAVLTRGEGGNCSLGQGCAPDLGTVRTAEMERVADAYGAELIWAGLKNFPLPDEDSAAWRRKVLDHWTEQIDPVAWIQNQIALFRPDLVLSVDPSHGFYGHPEHKLTGQLVEEAISTMTYPTGVAPPALYVVLNRYWITAPFVGLDPGPYTDTWPVHQRCGEQRCVLQAVDIALNHASQMNDGMGLVNRVKWLVRRLYLRRVDLSPVSDSSHAVAGGSGLDASSSGPPR